MPDRLSEIEAKLRQAKTCAVCASPAIVHRGDEGTCFSTPVASEEEIRYLLDEVKRREKKEMELQGAGQLLEQENARLRETLRFYANNDIHSVSFDFRDNGARARAALEGK